MTIEPNSRPEPLQQLHPCRVYKAVGFDDEDLSRPVIGIANAFSDIVPGHSHLRQVAEFVKKGVHLAGANAVEFGVIGCCDSVGNSTVGGHFILPSREIIADSVEIMAKAHRLDGLVLLCACDKIVPGMLICLLYTSSERVGCGKIALETKI